MTGKSLNLMLVCLNSKLIEWYFDKICPSTGAGTNQWKKFVLEQIPIPKISSNKEEEFNHNTSLLLEMKSKNLDYLCYEDKLNNLVYELYNLTPQEISIINNSMCNASEKEIDIY